MQTVDAPVHQTKSVSENMHVPEHRKPVFICRVSYILWSLYLESSVHTYTVMKGWKTLKDVYS